VASARRKPRAKSRQLAGAAHGGLRVLVLHNTCRAAAGQEEDAASVRGVLDEAAAVAQACRRLGWAVAVLSAPETPRALLDALFGARPDVVFNLVEEYQGRAEGEAGVAGILELAGLPYTGSPPLALDLALNKPLTKAVLQSHGIPVPPGALLETGNEPLAGVRFPCIVKLPRADASVGLSSASVVRSEAAARAQARSLIARYGQGALVEEFVGGREFEAAFLGTGEELTELPLAELDYSGFPEGAPRLMVYHSKWTPDSPEFKGTRNVPARAVPKPLAARMLSLARASYRLLGLRDYGRVDLRLSLADEPMVLEVNPNPDVAQGAALALALQRAGIPYAEFVRRTVSAALARQHGGRVSNAPCSKTAHHQTAATMRLLKATDRAPLRNILAATKHFSAEEITVALELLDDGLKKPGVSPQGYCFIVAELGGAVAGYVCFGRTPFTAGAYDMYWIAVDPALWGRGIGRALAQAAEDAARKAGGRLMVAETASKPSYAGTRAFYERNGYCEEARVRGFYAAGDDKILYVKRL